MKAIRIYEYGGPEVMKYEDVEDPVPQGDQVVVAIRAAGINPVDTYHRSGSIYKPKLPFTPGSDAAGIVESTGPDVKSFSRGDRVYVAGSISGTYAEKTLCHEYQIHHLPPNITDSCGAAIGITYATATRAILFCAKAIPGEIILVHGATGGVGTAAVQIAKSMGLIVIGTGGTAKGREMVLEQGAHHVVNHYADGYLDEIVKITDMKGVSIILEMLANVNLAHDLKLLAIKGRIVVIGNRGKIEIDPRDLMKKDGEIIGMLLSNADKKEMCSIHSLIQTGLENGSLRPVVGRELSLKDASEAHRIILEKGAYGKIVLLP